jgi:hypothetical protein
VTNGEVFRKAADYIRKYGWLKGGFGDEGGPRCVLGALGGICGWQMGAGVIWDATDRSQAGDVLRAVGARLGINVTELRDASIAIADWNDARAQKPEEVLDLLDGLAFDEDLKAAAKAPANELLATAEKLAVPEPVKETVGV